MSTVALTQQSTGATRDGGTGLTTSANSSLTATTNTYTFINDGRTIVRCNKTGAGACTVTATTPATVRGVAIADPTYTVPATTGNVYLGPFSPDIFNDANGLVSLVFSETTGLTVEVISAV